MCGRFVMTLGPDKLRRVFGVTEVPLLPPRYNIAPTQQILSVCQNGDGYRHLKSFRWGLIPPWSKDSSIGNKMINARCETIHEKPSFRGPIRFHRCLIPASGFFEWQQIDGRKQPYLIQRKDSEPMAFAGIWESWKNDGETIETCAILTTEANSLMRDIHNRMPVILSSSEFDHWLDRNITDPAQLKGLYTPFPSESLQAILISTAINNTRHDIPDCLVPLDS